MDSNPYFVTRQRLVQAPPGAIFELLADPSKHPLIDGSGTVKRSRQQEPQRLSLHAEFGMDMRLGVGYRIQNTVVEFEEARLIAWRHFNGHRWRYELIPAPRGTLVRETWDASRLKRQWPLKALGFTRSTPVNIERTLERLADYFDPQTPRPTDPEPPRPSQRKAEAEPETAAQAEKKASQKQARAAKAIEQDEAAEAARLARTQRQAQSQEARIARRTRRAEKGALVRDARAVKEAEQAEKAAREEQAKAEKAAAAEQARAAKAEQAAREEQAKAEKIAATERARTEKVEAVERAKAEKIAATERARTEKVEAAERAKATKIAREENDRKARVARTASVPAAKPAAKPAKQSTQPPVEPLPPIGGTAQPVESAPPRPSREMIAAAKAGRFEKPAAEPAPVAPASESKKAPARSTQPMAAARRMRRAS